MEWQTSLWWHIPYFSNHLACWNPALFLQLTARCLFWNIPFHLDVPHNMKEKVCCNIHFIATLKIAEVWSYCLMSEHYLKARILSECVLDMLTWLSRTTTLPVENSLLLESFFWMRATVKQPKNCWRDITLQQHLWHCTGINVQKFIQHVPQDCHTQTHGLFGLKMNMELKGRMGRGLLWFKSSRFFSVMGIVSLSILFTEKTNKCHFC